MLKFIVSGHSEEIEIIPVASTVQNVRVELGDSELGPSGVRVVSMKDGSDVTDRVSSIEIRPGMLAVAHVYRYDEHERKIINEARDGVLLEEWPVVNIDGSWKSC